MNFVHHISKISLHYLMKCRTHFKWSILHFPQKLDGFENSWLLSCNSNLNFRQITSQELLKVTNFCTDRIPVFSANDHIIQLAVLAFSHVSTNRLSNSPKPWTVYWSWYTRLRYGNTLDVDLVCWLAMSGLTKWVFCCTEAWLCHKCDVPVLFSLSYWKMNMSQQCCRPLATAPASSMHLSNTARITPVSATTRRLV